jgi:hypothetical protein
MEARNGTRKENNIEMMTYRLKFGRMEAGAGTRKENVIEMVTYRL